MKRQRSPSPLEGQSSLSLDAAAALDAEADATDATDAETGSSEAPPATEPATELPRKPARRATAEMLASRQREISVSEFFTKNRHLLGFDNPAKSLLTTIKEAVDNSLDACEEAGILPDIRVEVEEAGEARFRVAVQDNGPGIVRAQVPKIFAKLLYGSKFHRLKQSRGQQGIGISAAGLYAQLTTGKPITILSKTGRGRPARRIELRIDTARNMPEVLSDIEADWDVDHGTRVEMELAGTYRGGRTSIDASLVDAFSRVSASVAQQVCDTAGVPSTVKASKLTGDEIEAIHQALSKVKVMAPPASCVVPIGEGLIEAGLRRRFEAEFFTAVTRPPAVYRGNPFVVECGLAYGGKLPTDDTADIMRFANRVPLQYQPKACATTEAVYQTNWKAYSLAQPKGSLPVGPLAVVIHLASVWVPFTSEAKEAVAHYPELLKEMRLAIQEAGRRLATHLRARNRVENELKRARVFERYIPELGASLSKITGSDPSLITQSLFEALPSFVNLESPDNGDNTNGGDEGGAPSMPPPDDVLADEPPEERRKNPRKGEAVSDGDVAPIDEAGATSDEDAALDEQAAPEQTAARAAEAQPDRQRRSKRRDGAKAREQAPTDKSAKHAKQAVTRPPTKQAKTNGQGANASNRTAPKHRGRDDRQLDLVK